jgi:hypothetical protein
VWILPAEDAIPQLVRRHRCILPDAASMAALEYARHGRSIGGESPLEEEVVLTPSRRQLRRREAGWEGSPRRTSAPRNTNRVEGGAIWVSLLKKVKPVTINRVVMNHPGFGRDSLLGSGNQAD